MGANWANRESHDFYVYTFAYPESMGGAVFYVGKGIGGRINDHFREARREHQCQKCEIIRAIQANDEEVVVGKPYTNLTGNEALRYEQEVMSLFDFNTLANKIKKGNNKWMTEEWRAKRSQTTKEQWIERKTSIWWQKKHA